MRPSAFVALAVLVAGCSAERAAVAPTPGPAVADAAGDSLRFPGETHLRNVRQLTFGGNNAEAYWSFDGRQLVFQSDWAALNAQGCDQQFVMNADGSPLAGPGALTAGPGASGRYRLVSTGQGRTTCGYFLPDGRVLYASTHAAAPACPTTAASRTGRYVWDVFPTFDIYTAAPDGSDVRPLVTGEGYDAEATVSPDGRFVIFTSTRSGDLELWRLELATGALLQLTDTPGYDGGAFFSPDSRQIVWRASRPTGDDLAGYQTLLAQYVVEPGALNLFVADVDGRNARQVTDLPGANWAPFFHPNGRQIVFATNHRTVATNGGRTFDLYRVNTDGTGLERLTFSDTFDAFPMFSPDGSKLVFASNRRADRQPSRETNIFVADWVE
jgi:Tol biopolymer transport system component